MISRIYKMALIGLIVLMSIGSASAQDAIEVDVNAIEVNAVVTIWGRVTDSATKLPIANAKVYANLIPPQTVYTNASGYYVIYYRNFCDLKQFTISKAGYYTRITRVADGTCPECYPQDVYRRCATSLWKNFTLVKNPYAQAGRLQMEVDSLNSPSDILALFSILWGMYNYHSYDSLQDLVVGILNGPDYLCGNPVHDFDNNGVADEEEGTLPDNLTFEDYRNALSDAIEACFYPVEPEEPEVEIEE